ncbi:MAG: twin-arginine translocation signal domain-containing protein [Candidatus Rokubacteria bacterium]|nr:twin-arginine translocation signal domain-containing protein [Candidatus Rokubacteria bacterium]
MTARPSRRDFLKTGGAGLIVGGAGLHARPRFAQAKTATLNMGTIVSPSGDFLKADLALG